MPFPRSKHRDEAIRRYASGEPAEAIARALNVSFTTVRRWWREAGKPWRTPRKVVTARTHPRFGEAVARYVAGETSTAIARDVGVSGRTVLDWLAQAGVQTRKPHPCIADEQRRDAVARVRSGVPMTVVGRELGVTGQAVRHWCMRDLEERREAAIRARENAEKRAAEMRTRDERAEARVG